MALATLSDYETRKGDVPDSQESIVEALLDDASALILDNAGSGAEWLEADAEEEDHGIPRSITAVCVAVAHRAFTNPTAVASKALGSASYTYKGDEPDALYLTDREIRTIHNASSRSSFRSITLVTPYSGDDEEANDLPL